MSDLQNLLHRKLARREELAAQMVLLLTTRRAWNNAPTREQQLVERQLEGPQCRALLGVELDLAHNVLDECDNDAVRIVDIRVQHDHLVRGTAENPRDPLLEQRGEKVLPAADDDVLLPLDDKQRARVDEAEVPGREPVGRERHRPAGLGVEVAGGDTRPAQRYLPEHGVAGERLAIVSDDADRHARQRRADRKDGDAPLRRLRARAYLALVENRHRLADGEAGEVDGGVARRGPRR